MHTNTYTHCTHVRPVILFHYHCFALLARILGRFLFPKVTVFAEFWGISHVKLLTFCSDGANGGPYVSRRTAAVAFVAVAAASGDGPEADLN